MKALPFTLLLLPYLTFAQTTDSLLTLLKKVTRNDTNTVNILNDLGKAYWLEGEDSLAAVSLNRAIAAARKTRFPEGEAHARLQLVRMELDELSDVGTAFRHLDTVEILAKQARKPFLKGMAVFRKAQLYGTGYSEKTGEVRPLMEEARQIFVKEGNKAWEGKVYAELSELAAREGNYTEGIDLLLKARKLQEASGDAGALRATIPNLGVMFTKVGKLTEALKCFEEAERTALKSNDVRVLGFIYNQKGDIFKKQGKLEEALSAYGKAVVIFEKTGSIHPRITTYARLSAISLELDQPDLALKYNLLADSLYKNTIDGVDSSLYTYTQINYGDIYLYKKNYPEARRQAQKGLLWAQASDPFLVYEVSQYHRQLAEANLHLGEYLQAYNHLKLFKQYSDSLLNDETLQKISVSSMTYEFEKKQQADALRIQQLENEKLTRTRNLLFALSVLGITLFSNVAWSNRKLKASNLQLKNKNREIEMALDRGQKIERRRVASELHDHLNTKLAALRWNMEAMNPELLDPHNKSLYEKLTALAKDAYDDVRFISHNMLPPELEASGLQVALQALTQRLGTNGRLQINLEISGMESRLPKNTEHQLYNIVLESLNNVLKHADATQVWIRLNKIDNALTLTVSDDGIGLSPDSSQTGMGLRNIAHRAESIGGQLHIESAENKGTSLTVSAPV